VTDPEHRNAASEGLREYFLRLGPEGRHHLVVALGWLTVLVTIAIGCGIVIGLWI
jgi:hypothetical protein